MLIVIAVVSTLSVLLFTAGKTVVESSKSVTCLSNLKQIYSACLNYGNDNEGWLVPSGYYDALNDGGYLPSDSKVWTCPSDNRTDRVVWGVATSYGCNADQVGWVPQNWDRAQQKLIQIKSPSQTVYFSDSTAYIMRTYNPMWTFRHRNNSINAVFFDGHAENLSMKDPGDFQKLVWPD